MKHFVDNGEEVIVLERLNLMVSYEDEDYVTVYKENVKYFPTDEIMRILINDSTTTHWNPIIFAIYYQRLDILQYLCDHLRMVPVRSCLVKPFLMQPSFDEDMGLETAQNEDEFFIHEKTELFCLVLPLMLKNKEIFRFLLKSCSFIWNDIHLAILTNFVLESKWVEGIKVLFTSPAIH